MTVGARDPIDRELVRKYAKLKMDNPEITKLLGSSDALDMMSDIGEMKMIYSRLAPALTQFCLEARKISTPYRKINFTQPRRRA